MNNNFNLITVKALLSPWGAYLILGLKKRGLNREGGAYFKSYHNIFSKLYYYTTEQAGLCITVLQMQRHFYLNQLNDSLKMDEQPG